MNSLNHRIVLILVFLGFTFLVSTSLVWAQSLSPLHADGRRIGNN
jgi:hypothetical protein